MILEVVRESGLSAWLTDLALAEGPEPTPMLDRVVRHQEDLATAIVEHLRTIAVPPRAARKWLQVAREQVDPDAHAVEAARGELEAFVRLILPQILHDPRQLRD
jgi:hypothetical protein